MEKKQHSVCGIKTAVLINNSANGGKGIQKWLKIREEIVNRLPPETHLVSFSPPYNMKEKIIQLYSTHGVRFFISAGGDGTVNHLINNIAEINQEWLTQITVGAIGIGSSNDFHKPYHTMIHHIPVRTDLNNTNRNDIGQVQIESEKGVINRLFCIGAGLGFTAFGNAFYNNGDCILHFLKKTSTPLSILWAVVKTFRIFQNIPMTLTISEKSVNMQVTNLSIAKNPNISGNFCYDMVTPADSGKFGLYIAENMSKPEIIRLLFYLLAHRFSQLQKCSTSFISEIEILSSSEIPVETDGEIFHGNRFRFSVFPEKVVFAG